MLLFIFRDELQHKLYDLAVCGTTMITADISEFCQNRSVYAQAEMLFLIFHAGNHLNDANLTLF